MALTYVNQVGAPEGLNQAMPGTTLPDTYVRWAQDALFDRVGTVRRRGPFTEMELYDATTGALSQPTSTGTQRVLGMMSTQNPNGDRVSALVVHDTSIVVGGNAGGVKVYFYDSSYRNIGSSILKTFVSGAADVSLICNSNALFTSTAAIGGGVYFSILNGYHTASATNVMASYYWSGGIGTDVEAGSAISATISIDSGSGATSTYGPTITKTSGTWDTSTINPGMFVMDVVSNTSYYLGVVKSISGNTITLTKHALRMALSATDFASNNTTSRNIRFTNTRPYIHNHGRGLLTCATPAASGTFTSGNEGGSGEGHWRSAGLGLGWALYRASDHTWIGNIGSITNNASGTFHSANINTSLTDGITNGQYVAYRTSSAVSTSLVVNRTGQNYAGLFSASYQGYQWYANAGVKDKHNRIVFSADHNFESVDLSQTAPDSIELPNRGEIRGIASSSAGLVVLLEDKTYIIRGNDRSNFSLEELYPEGCLATGSIVEYGGGVFWVSKSGFLLYDGGSVRLLTGDNLGVYYTDSIRTFDPAIDRIYSFFYKNYLFVYFTKFDSVFRPQRYEPLYVTNWVSTGSIANLPYTRLDDAFEWEDFSPDNKIPVYWDSQDMYGVLESEIQGEAAEFDEAVFGDLYRFTNNLGKLNSTDGMFFALYLPSGAITTFSNMDFFGATIIEAPNGTTCLLGTNRDMETDPETIYARIINIDPVIDTNTTGIDPILIYNNAKAASLYNKGPDFFVQTKSYTVGDPVLKKWFQRLMVNMKLNSGAVRVDLVTDEDQDDINISLKSHKNWELFTPKGYTWLYLHDIIFPKYAMSNTSNWGDVTDQQESWAELLDPAFERFKKRFSWRSNSAGLRIYQLNKYEPANTPDGAIQLPDTVELSSWNIGFKPMREGRQ